MDKKMAGLLGAAASLASLGAAQAATDPASNLDPSFTPSSYRDLLAPIPNAKEALKADNLARAQELADKAAGEVQTAQYPYYYPYYPYYRYWPYYRHHHHHHNWYRYRHHHHHHHHHH